MSGFPASTPVATSNSHLVMVLSLVPLESKNRQPDGESPLLWVPVPGSGPRCSPRPTPTPLPGKIAA